MLVWVLFLGYLTSFTLLFELQILLLALFLYILQLPLIAQRIQSLPAHCIMIKDQNHGSGRQALMRGFLLALGRPLTALMMGHLIREIYTVLFVMRVVPWKYLMCQILIVFSLWINLYLEELTLLMHICGISKIPRQRLIEVVKS